MGDKEDGMKNWSNEYLIDQLIIRSNQVSIISESNDIAELREEVMSRMSNGVANNQFDVPHDSLT